MKKFLLLVTLYLLAGFCVAGMTTKYKVKGYIFGDRIKNPEDGNYQVPVRVLRDIQNFNEDGKLSNSANADVSFVVVLSDADSKSNAKIKAAAQKMLTPTKTPTPNIIPE